MSKKLCDEYENGYKSDISYTSTSNSDLDKRKKKSRREKTPTECEEIETKTSTHRTSNKLAEAPDARTNKTYSASGTSLDEDLYGVSDVYCRTLKELKTKLHCLNVNKPTNSEVTFKSETVADSSLRHKTAVSNDEEECKFSSDLKVFGYVCDKETNTPKPNIVKKTPRRLSSSSKVTSDHGKKKFESKPKFSQEVSKILFKKQASDKKMHLDVTSDSEPLDLVTILKPVKMPSTASTFIACNSEEDTKCLGSRSLKQSVTILKNMIIRDYGCSNYECTSRSPEMHEVSKNNTSSLTNSFDSFKTIVSSSFYKPHFSNENFTAKSTKLSCFYNSDLPKKCVRAKTSISSSYYKPQIRKDSADTFRSSSHHTHNGSARPKANRSSGSNDPRVSKENVRYKSYRSSSACKLGVNKKNTHSITPGRSSFNKTENSKKTLCARNRRLCLPSSIDSDCTSSDDLKINPSIITISGEKKSKRFHKRRNKIAPFETISTSSSLSDETKKVNQLFLKYYNDTPDVTPNSCATPPHFVSTCASASTTETTPRTDPVSAYSNLPLEDKSSFIHSSKQSHASIAVFDPIFSSGLDVPRKSAEVLNFPTITKITNVIKYPEVDVVLVNEDYNNVKFTSLAEKIKNEMYNSRKDIPVKQYPFKINKLNKIDKNSKTQNPRNDIHDQNRTVQLAYYEVSSTDSKTEEDENQIDKLDVESYTNSDDEQPSKCYCFCNWMFPKKRRNYFT